MRKIFDDAVREPDDLFIDDLGSVDRTVDRIVDVRLPFDWSLA
jgi:hypothetical protein